MRKETLKKLFLIYTTKSAIGTSKGENSKIYYDEHKLCLLQVNDTFPTMLLK